MCDGQKEIICRARACTVSTIYSTKQPAEIRRIRHRLRPPKHQTATISTQQTTRATPPISRRSNMFLFKKSRRKSSARELSPPKGSDPHHSERLLQGAHDEYTFPQTSLLGLPNEIISRILQNLDIRDFLALALVCRPMHDFVDKFFLYRNVKIHTKQALGHFKKTISKDKKRNVLQLYVQRIEFIKPEKDTSKEKTSIGAFTFSSNAPSDSYIALLLEVVALLPNLSEISLRQISPGFQFPEWTSSLKTYATEHNYYPTLRKLRMSSESGWSIPLRPNLLWPFGLIEELILYDMVIDSHSLSKPALLTLANENGPLISKDALTLESNNRHSPIRELTLSSCSIASNGSRFLAGYFREVVTLKLLSLKSHYDILLSHCFPKLEVLHIDLNSRCFSMFNSSEASVVNTANNNSNYAYFNQKFVPKFYLNYGHFIQIMDRLPTVGKVSFVNVSFTNVTPVDPEDTQNPESNLVNNNGFRFLVTLQKFSRIEFIMLKNYKLHQRRTRDDWEKLLAPCFTSSNSIRVMDKDGSVLFARNERA